MNDVQFVLLYASVLQCCPLWESAKTGQPNFESMNVANNISARANMFLLGAIFNILANVNMESLADYSFKAIIGGAIWLAFKVLGDYISTKLKGGKNG